MADNDGLSTPTGAPPAAERSTAENLRDVIWECRQERMGEAEAVKPEAPPAHPAPLVRETDRMLRQIDRQLDHLLSSKSALLRMREQLVSGSSQ